MVGTPEHPGCMVRALNELYEKMEKSAAEAVFKGFYVQSKPFDDDEELQF